MSASSVVSKVNMLRLYRSIRKHHRAHLPPQLRELGDETLRNEWKQHKSADAKFVTVFKNEWESYLAQLRAQQFEQQQATQQRVFGRYLQPDEVAKMTDEQKQTLLRLHNAAVDEAASHQRKR